MKRTLKILKIAFIVLVIMCVVLFIYIKNREIPDVEVSNIELSNIDDSVYEGEYTEGLVKVVVEVEVKDSRIVNINLKEHQNGLGQKAEKIIDEIINNQSLDVDVISGATLSSNVIRRAVQESLSK